MGSEPRQLHVAFFPLMAPGHTIPILDIVTIFSTRNIKITLLTTPLNAPDISQSLYNRNIDGAINFINIEVIPFPSHEAGLPEGVENLDSVPSHEMNIKFMLSMELLKGPLENFLEKTRPDCLVADWFFPFATDVAAKFGIPRLVFHGSNFFSVCVMDAVQKYKPDELVMSDDEPFVISHLPHEIKLTKSQLMKTEENGSSNQSDLMRLFAAARESEAKSFGVLNNSFYELEPEYVEYYKKILGRKAWHIGPVSLSNRLIEEKRQRGKKASINEDECLKWLDSKEHGSVIYVCFGSLCKFSPSQLKEIAMALESSELQFIWVVKKGISCNMNNEEWLPDDFEKKIRGKGLIIRGWAPQVMILDHKAIGGFVTHCGWNSILEGISAGVPMVTWPLFAEQFVNEKLVTDVLKIGVQVGSKQWNIGVTEGAAVKREAIITALKEIMEGEEALEMRNRAKKLKDMAWKAMEEGGSSCSDLDALIQELSNYKSMI